MHPDRVMGGNNNPRTVIYNYTHFRIIASTDPHCKSTIISAVSSTGKKQAFTLPLNYDSPCATFILSLIHRITKIPFTLHTGGGFALGSRFKS